MERLQEAIAKSREPALGIVTRLPAHRPALVPMNPVAPPRTVADNWASLRPCEPDPKHLRRNRIVTAFGGTDARPFDLLRTKTLQTMRANGWRRLAIASPTAGCGKTVVTLNLAFSLSRQPDTRTVVVELDLRRPSLSAMLGAAPETCVTSVLAGGVAFGDQALCYQGNLALTLCAGFQGDPAEVLLNPLLARRIAAIETMYSPDLIVFDVPPMLTDDTMTAIATQADCVLLVAAAGRTTAADIDRCEREIARQTNVLGVVLNDCRYGTA